jgi:hypothetical protein
MSYKIEIEDSDIQVIQAFCDIALKNGGLQYYGAVARILSLLPKPEIKEDEKDG